MLSFPSNPTDGQLATYYGNSYIFSNGIWRKNGDPATRVLAASHTNLRISLSNALHDQTRVIRSSKLYVHRYKGSTVSLYNPELAKWTFRELPVAPMEFSFGTIVPNRAHDVYIFDTSPNASTPVFSVEFLAWQDNLTKPVREFRDGVWVRNGFPSRKYIGTILTSQNAQSEVESRRGGEVTKLNAVENAPRIGLINQYNRIPTSFSLRLSDSFGKNTGGEYETPNGYDDEAKMTILTEDPTPISATFTANVGAGANGTTNFGLSFQKDSLSPYSSIVTRNDGNTEPFSSSGSLYSTIYNSGVSSLYYVFKQSGTGQFNAAESGAGFVVSIPT